MGSTPVRMFPHTSKLKRIARGRYLQSGSLGPAELEELVDILYDIYRETACGCTRDEFADVVFKAGDGRFALFCDERDHYVGFSYAAFDFLQHGGTTQAVINAGVFFRPGYCGGATAAFFGLRQALRFKICSPRTPLAYATRSSSPAVYRLLASTMPRMYPNRRHPTPANIEALALAISSRRHYKPVGGNPWVVRSDAVPLDVACMRRLNHDPDVQFYTELVPRYAEGESVLVWIPLDLANIAGGLLRLLRARLLR